MSPRFVVAQGKVFLEDMKARAQGANDLGRGIDQEIGEYFGGLGVERLQLAHAFLEQPKFLGP